MRKPGRGVYVLLVLVLAGGWWARGHYFLQITNPEPRGSAIIVLGDSIAAGYQVQREACFVSLLARDLGMPVVNAGVPGDTTGSALERLEVDVLRQSPKVVLVELGGNDLLNQVSHTVTERNLTQIVTRIQAQGAAVVILGVDGPFGLGGMGAVYKRVAKQHGAAYVPNIMSGLLGDKRYMVDQIHPNAAGHQIIAERVEKVLRRGLPKVFGQ